MDNGFITLHRKLLGWQWYQDNNVKSLFIHLLLKANHKDNPHQGVMIKRGQHKTGLKKLSYELGLSEQQVKTALSKLIKTNEVTSKSTNRYRIITVLKYNEYQLDNKQNNKQITNNQQTDNKQITTNNNDNTEKNENKVTKRFVPPTLEMVINYCKERKNTVDSNKFIDYYTSNGWQVGRNKMKDWKAAVRTWERSNYNNGKQKEDISNINYNISGILEDNVTIRMRKDYCDKMGISMKDAPSDATILQYEKL